VVLSEVKLEGTASTDAGTGDEIEFKSPPWLLDLSGASLDNGTTQQITLSDVKPGTYREIKFKIHKPAQTDTGVSADAGLATMASLGFSIVVDGTIDGTRSLSIRRSMRSSRRRALQFQRRQSRPDAQPRCHHVVRQHAGVATRSPQSERSVRSQIENNIQNSFKAFQDDDHNGREDHG